MNDVDPDFALSQQHTLLQILFDHMPVGIAIFDRRLRVRRFNPTWANFVDRYTPSSAAEVLPGAHFFDLAPGAEDNLMPVFTRVLTGESLRLEGFRIQTGGIVSYWDVAFTPLVENGEVVGILDVTTDATDRVLAQQEAEQTLASLHTAYQTMEQHVVERTHELTTLLDISHHLSSTLDLEPLLDLILEQIKPVVDYTGVSIMTIEEADLRIIAYRGPIPQDEVRQLRFPLDGPSVNREVIKQRRPIIIKDVLADGALERRFRQSAGDRLQTTFAYIHSWLGAPLLVQERVIGMLSFDHSQAGYYSQGHADLALAFANHVAMAIENARLYQAEQERRHEAEQRRQVAEGLRDILKLLNSDRPLSEVLVEIIALASRLLKADAGVIYRMDTRRQRIDVEALAGMPADFQRFESIPLLDTEANQAILERRPFAVADLAVRLATVYSDEASLPPELQEWAAVVSRHFSSYVSVPLVLKDEVYGAISLYYRAARAFDHEDIELAVTFADQAALAIENARLRAQAEASAVTAERSRLARDLHDAVTQTLFSASLIADVLPRLWQRSPEQGRQRLDELRELTRGALAEMRTLLLELRPATLTEVSLGDLLRQLKEAIGSRTRIAIDLQVEGERPLPPEVQVALYRIAQESLNNVSKHAGSTQVTIRLRCLPQAVSLSIEDNGRGFDLADVPHNSLGLGIMRERAGQIGAHLDIQSQIGDGALVSVVWPVHQDDEAE